MFKFLIGNKLANTLIKKLVEKYLVKKLGDDTNVSIDKFVIEENNGRLALSINANIDISVETAENIINQL